MRGGTSTRREIVLKLYEKGPFSIGRLGCYSNVLYVQEARGTVEVGPRGDAV